MNNKKKFLSGLLAIAILVAIYSIVYWVVPIDYSTTKILGYVFTLIAVCVFIYSYYVAFGKCRDAKSVVYGLPIIRVGIIYLIAQIVVSTLLLVLSRFVDIKTWISLIVLIVMLGAALIGELITVNTRDYVRNLESKTTESLKSMKYFNADVTALIDKCSDADVKNNLLKLAEECRYSDPVSNEETIGIEENIKSMIDELAQQLAGLDKVEAITRITAIRDVLRDRNRRCKLSKG